MGAKAGMRDIVYFATNAVGIAVGISSLWIPGMLELSDAQALCGGLAAGLLVGAFMIVSRVVYSSWRAKQA